MGAVGAVGAVGETFTPSPQIPITPCGHEWVVIYFLFLNLRIGCFFAFLMNSWIIFPRQIFDLLKEWSFWGKIVTKLIFAKEKRVFSNLFSGSINKFFLNFKFSFKLISMFRSFDLVYWSNLLYPFVQIIDAFCFTFYLSKQVENPSLVIYKCMKF